ncbi:hypothetical protein GCM10017708_38570 [Arthrobacter citreus]
MRSITLFTLPGIAEIAPGTDLTTVILAAAAAAAGADPEAALQPGDILVVTSKIVSKAEGRQLPAEDREQAITEETVRLVASRVHPGGVTRIVENKLGIVAAAAGVDNSNTPAGTVLLLPVDPDASARALCAGCGGLWASTSGWSSPTRWAGPGARGRPMPPSALPAWMSLPTCAEATTPLGSR